MIAQSPHNKRKPNQWESAPEALPPGVARWLGGIGRANAHAARALRFVVYWHQSPEDAETLGCAWSSIERAAISEEKLIGLFMSLPDVPTVDQYPAIHEPRSVDAGEELRRNRKTRKHIDAVIASLSGNALRRYAGDAKATGEQAVAAYQAFAEAKRELQSGLRAYDQMLERIDPAAKLPTAHYASTNLATKNYRRAVAGLNHYLREPRHAALSVIAAVNCPDCIVDRNTLSKIWNRSGDRNHEYL